MLGKYCMGVVQLTLPKKEKLIISKDQLRNGQMTEYCDQMAKW